MAHLTDGQWNRFQEDGYVNLGRVLNDADLAALQQRIDDIMLGRANVDYDRILMQLDSDTGRYDDAGEQSHGLKKATLNYRKVENLELDPLFLAYMQRPVFGDACARIYGAGADISVFRAMFMNKPAHKGTLLPWHQDRWHKLDRDPFLTVWTALDPATRENGCVQVIPGSHRKLINPDHEWGFLTEALAEEFCPADQAIHLELEAGEAMLLHNWLLHASDRNNSAQSRRAFSVCYMEASTFNSERDGTHPVVFGQGALTPASAGTQAVQAAKGCF